MRPGTDAAVLRGYVVDPFVKAALERVLLRAERAAIEESSERFAAREWREKAGELERERDAFMAIFSGLASQPCSSPSAMSTCMDRLPRDPNHWCRPCWSRSVIAEVVL